MSNTERHSQPVVLTAPNGYKIPVQSLKAGATLLGRIYYRQTGNTDFYLDYKGLQNMIKCGINNFHQGPLQGWSVEYYGKTDAEHWDLFLDEIGVEGSFRQSQNQLKTNMSSSQDQHEINMSSSQDQHEINMSSSQDQHEINMSSSQDQVGFTTKQLSNIATNQINNKATEQLSNKATEQLSNKATEQLKPEVDGDDAFWEELKLLADEPVKLDPYAELKKRAISAPVITTIEPEIEIKKTGGSYSEKLYRKINAGI
jgi:hypothetical protein